MGIGLGVICWGIWFCMGLDGFVLEIIEIRYGFDV